MPQAPWEKYAQPQEGPWTKYATTDTAVAPPAPAKPMSTFERIRQSVMSEATPVIDVAKGVAKGAGSTAVGLIQGQQKIHQPLTGRPPMATPQILTPTNAAQKVGFGAEQMGEFILPGAILKTGRMGTLARAGAEAASAGTVAMAQTGGDTATATKAALLGGSIPFVAKPVAWLGTKLGTRIQNSVLRATDADVKHGFKIENVFKYDVGGSPQAVANKSAAQIQDLVGQLKAELGTNPSARIDILDLLNQAQKELTKNAASQFGRNAPVQNALNKLLDELALVTPSGKVDIADAQAIKRSLGSLGSWLNGARDPESKGMEIAANTLYTKVRTAIEGAVANGAKVKEINRKLGELIPIEHVAIKRIPVADRMNAISLTDVISGVGAMAHPSTWWIVIANQLSKRGTVGAGLVKAGAKTTGATVAPIAAGAVTANRPRP